QSRWGSIAALSAAAGTRCAPSAPSSAFVLSSFTVAALDLVFPALCPVCDTTLGAGRRGPLCGTCWSAISRLGAPWCDRCGAASIVTEAVPPCVAPRLTCALCASAPPPYDYARSAALYEGPLRDAIHA